VIGIRLAAASAGLLVLSLTACSAGAPAQQPAPPAPSSGAAAASATGAEMAFDLATVRSQLAAIPVKPVAPYADYDRVADFGEAWIDVDGNGCDTRDDILRRDLVDVSVSDCKVESGTLHDPYSGDTVHFVRGPESSESVQIDHVVPVYEAWRTGAQQWSKQQRIDFANDPLNLLASAGDANQDKGDLDPSRWLPPLKSYRCEYVERYVSVVAKYGLFVTSREKPAISAVLAACPS
jgi:hypothetical protein